MVNITTVLLEQTTRESIDTSALKTGYRSEQGTYAMATFSQMEGRIKHNHKRCS
jgi:hypothetical protein